MKNIDFEVIVKEKEGKYCLFVPKLSLYSESENLNVAYENIIQQRQSLQLYNTRQLDISMLICGTLFNPHASFLLF